MAISKVPDAALLNLRCPCSRYLSSTPISVCHDGRSICKDCIDVQAPYLGTFTQNFAYEALAILFKFPCRYKAHGCRRYVEFSKAVEHEDECSYRTYQCPVDLLSTCAKRGTATELYQHYEQEHPELHLNHPNFTINVSTDFEVHRLYKADEVVLLLQTKCSVKQGKVWFNTVYFGNVSNASLIQYKIKLSSYDSKKRIMELEEEKACSINNIHMLPSQFVEVDIPIATGFLQHPDFIQCSWVITIPEELKTRIKDQQKLEQQEIFEVEKESICCPNCKVYMVPPIYRCNKNHVTCVDCKSYSNQCRSCLKNDVKFTNADDLEAISKSGSHRCRWSNCNQHFAYEEVRSHERECCFREYTCPECGVWVGMYDMLLNHLKHAHRDLNIYVTNPIPVHLQNCCCYIIVQKEVFKFVTYYQQTFGGFNSGGVTFGCAPEGKLDIKIYCLSLPSFANYWEYEVKDETGAIACTLTNFSDNQYTGSIHNQKPVFGGVQLANAKVYTFFIVKKSV